MSSTNVGSIHYELGLDTSKFDKAMAGIGAKTKAVGTVEKSKVEKVFNAYVDDIYQINGEIEKSRLGKILTVVDGAIADETQRKAVKDLVHDAWYSATAYRTYPQPRHVAEALGIDLKRDVPIAATSPDEYNPYKEVIKD